MVYTTPTRWLHRLIFVGVGALLGIATLLTIARAQAQTGDTVIAQDVLAVAKVISYQGRLLDAATNIPRTDGTYKMDFALYAADTGGTALWSETQNVALQRGIFSTLLGSVAAFPPTLFNGQNLWLGVAVNNEAQMTPRTRIAPVAYALYSDNADKLDNKDSTAFAAASHTHDGGAIVSGAVAEPRIDPALARDNEVMPIVVAASGSGSGLSADYLDGYDSSGFYIKSAGTFRTGYVLGANSSIDVTTFGWPLDRPVVWYIVPTTTGGYINLTVGYQLEFPGGGPAAMTYHLNLSNPSGTAVTYNILYATLN